jgi:hypothetical protein
MEPKYRAEVAGTIFEAYHDGHYMIDGMRADFHGTLDRLMPRAEGQGPLKQRVRIPAPHAQDHLYLVNEVTALSLYSQDRITMASIVLPGTVLIGMLEPLLPGSYSWGGEVESYTTDGSYKQPYRFGGIPDLTSA